MNTPHLTVTRHLACCGKVIVVSAFATECSPNPLDTIREVMVYKIAQHKCEDTIPWSLGTAKNPTSTSKAP